MIKIILALLIFSLTYAQLDPVHMRTLTDFNANAAALTVSPKGKYVAIGSKNGDTIIYDLPDLNIRAHISRDTE